MQLISQLRKKWMIASVMFFVACSVTRSSLYPVAADVERVKTAGIITNLDSLKKGFNIYLDKCSGCHNLHKPAERNREEWDAVLPKMFEKSHLGPQDRELVKAYIFSKS